MTDLPKYPFIDRTQFNKDALGMLKNYIIYKAINRLKPEEDKRKTRFYDIFGSLLDTTQTFHRQNFLEKCQRIFPKITTWYNFSEGASNVQELYTTVIDGAEFPVYLRGPKDTIPTDETLNQNIKIARDTKKSFYNERNAVLDLYDHEFSNIAAEKYSRCDFKNIEDPHEFRKWFVRDDTWLIQQYGERAVSDEKEIELEGKSYHVNVYKRPNKFRTWLYWAIGDKIYDIVDAPFDPLQKRIETNMPADARQLMLKTEYKVITNLIRSLFVRKKPQLQYDATRFVPETV
jgi:hypothetical protein